MIVQSLNGDWKMTVDNGYGCINMSVPGSVYSAYLDKNIIEDPFYRDNEIAANKLMDRNYNFIHFFTASKEICESAVVFLRFHSIDTLGQVFVNNKKVGTCENMHRVYEYDVKDVIKEGVNVVEVRLCSPNKYIEKMHHKRHMWGLDCVSQGFNHLRKAHYMFGWDWGPTLPDCGIHRDVELIAVNDILLEDVYFTQNHYKFRDKSFVKLSVDMSALVLDDSEYSVNVCATAPDKKSFDTNVTLTSGEGNAQLQISQPMLWWPNGYGEQNLYDIIITVMRNGEKVLTKQYKLGLRKMEISRDVDKYGEDFCFKVNDVKIFARGANYIPEDNIVSRTNEQRTYKLLSDCAWANYNCIRVWGGGYYPPDYFYDICDKLGLIVWQDFMFACAVYEMTEPFKENIINEVTDNILRIRHHACLGLWCGNNEMEDAVANWPHVPKDEKMRLDYLIQYESIIKDLCEKFDPNTFYWPSSPSSGGGFLETTNLSKGDTHYWDVWHKNKPFEDFKNHYIRFCSEFGFESFPDIKTIESFTKKDERNVFSYVMEKHQKCASGNGKMLTYLSDTYKYPKNLESIIYATQLLQADAIRCGVEHWRRHRGRCMGAVYWQVNDCWPAPSWSSIDYYGRYKALHYAARKFYAPVLLSAHTDSFDDSLVTFSVCNETRDSFAGRVTCIIYTNGFRAIYKKSTKVNVDALTSKDVLDIDIREKIDTLDKKQGCFLCYYLEDENKIISKSSLLFVKPKHYNFKSPSFDVQVTKTECEFEIKVSSDVYAKGVRLYFDDMDCVFSDNYFDICDKNPVVITLDSKYTGQLSARQIKNKLKIFSVYDIE